MASKLLAARLASSEGTAVLIAGGGEPRISSAPWTARISVR